MKSILFVDDEKNVLDGVRRQLYAQRDQWDMHFALGGEEALETCGTRKFDVVISDMRMPGMDGATFLGHLRDRFPDAARLVLSGYADASLAVRAVPVAHRVLMKPCTGIELQSNIERVCALQDIFCSPDIRKIIGTIGELPSLSGTYTALAQAIRDPATSLAGIAKIIEGDIAMTAKVLQLVNSGFFGLAQKVTDVTSAIGFLGMETLKNLALASDTFRVFVPGSNIPLSYCERIQEHAKRTALIVGTFSLPPKIRDVCVVSALIHDIGELVLACKMPVEFCAAMDLARKIGCSRSEAEEQILGTSHADIGAYLLGLWGIDSLVVEAVAHHHRPTRVPHTGFDSSTALYVADLLANELTLHPDDVGGTKLSTYDKECLEALGVMPQYSTLRERALEVLG